MGEVGERPAAGRAAGLELRGGDEDGGDEAGGKQQPGHDQRRDGKDLIPAVTVAGVSGILQMT